jgi:hypothetical protein
MTAYWQTSASLTILSKKRDINTRRLDKTITFVFTLILNVMAKNSGSSKPKGGKMSGGKMGGKGC